MKDTQTTQATKTYIALGDSMSIDFYTGVKGGGAVSQFYKRLCQRPGTCWRLDDRTVDGQRMAGVDFAGTADLITMTIGGNDLVQNMDRDPAELIPEFAQGYGRLTRGIREAHPQAIVIVGNVYACQGLSKALQAALDECNGFIGRCVRGAGFRLADIHGAFLGHEDEYLCYGIEPTLKGATVIAGLFETGHELIPLRGSRVGRAQRAPA